MFIWFLNGKRLGELQIDDLRGGRKVIIFGSLRWNKRLSRLLDEVGRSNVLCIYEPDLTKWGTEFEEIPVLQPAAGQNALIISTAWDLEWKSTSAQAKALGYEDVYFFMSKEKTETIELYMDAFAPYAQFNVIPTNRTFKYVHLILDSTFFSSVAEIIEYGMDPNEHFFFIYNMADSPLTARCGIWEKYQNWMRKYHNIYLLQNKYPLYSNSWEENRESFDRLLEHANKMIFHGGHCIWSMEDYFRTKLDVIREKGLCIPWSGIRHEFGRERERFLREIVQHVRMMTYDVSGIRKFQEASFPVLQSAIWLKTYVSYARITKEPIALKSGKNKKILISHSADPITNAVETMVYLKNLDDLFHIYAIVSYGPEKEAAKIVELGTRLFGKRFTAIREFMEYDQYVEFLAQMDVVIFGMDQDCGRNTMELLLWTGAKLYLKPETTAWTMMEGWGYRLGNYHLIQGMTPDELIDDPNKEWNRRLASEREFDVDKKVQQWKELFEYDWAD